MSPSAVIDVRQSFSQTADFEFFSSPSFSATTSGGTMTGGGGSGPAGGLSQTFSYDPFGNMTESGSFGFSQSFGINNQINGYLYDANGNQTTDIYGQGLTFDANGMLSSVAGNAETYIYDPSGNRAEVHGATVTDYVYFGGIPIASLSGGLYTDLVYGGNTLLAEVGGWQAAFPTYRATDHLGSLVGDLGSSSSGGPVNYAPYGQLFSGSTADPYGYTGLQWDPTTATSHAMARQYSSQQGRWQSPDRYEGSYSWNDPQSLNRYSYVHNNPMGFIDPTGQIIQVPILDPGAAASEVTTAGEIAVGLSATALVIGIDLLITDLIDYLHRSKFHGSLEPRPTAGLWDDSFGIPYPGLNGAIGGALGLPSGGCEFGSCGSVGTDSFQAGAATAPATWCTVHPTICTVAEDAGTLLKDIPVVLASTMLLNMKGDNRPDAQACAKIRAQATNECSALLNTSSYPPGVNRPRRIPTGTDNSGAFFACIRQKMEDAGCPSY